MISDQALRRVLPKSAVELAGDLIRWCLWAFVFIIWAAFLQVYLRMIRLTLTDPSHSDFTIFYYTSRLVADGLPMYGVSPSVYGVAWPADHLGNLNPPHFQLLALPLGHLSYAHALAVWVTVSLASLVGALILIARELRIPWSWSRFWLWGAWTLSSAAFTTVAVTCEMTFLLMLPFTLAWRAWRNGRWTTAGAWLGACASLKLFLLLFVPWLIWRRHWRGLATFVLSMVAFIAVGMVVFGIEPYRQWATTLGRVGWWSLTMNASWQGFTSRIFEGTAKIAPLVQRPDLVRAIGAAGSALLACAAIVLAARRQSSRDAAMVVLLAGAVLSSPLGWVYYLPLGYGPLLGWAGADVGWQGIRSAGRRSMGLVLAAIALLYLPHELTASGQPSGISSVTIASAYFWALLLLWLGVSTSRHA
jgi:hypothetical protein